MDDQEFLVVCCVKECGAARLADGTWGNMAAEIVRDHGLRSTLSHGYCPTCYERAMRTAEHAAAQKKSRLATLR